MAPREGAAILTSPSLTSQRDLFSASHHFSFVASIASSMQSKQFASLLRPSLVAPEPREAHGGAEFPGFCLLLARDRDRPLEILFRF
jgi:hypothetical protein